MATTKIMKSQNVKDKISWMLFDLVEGVLILATFIFLGFALRGTL